MRCVRIKFSKSGSMIYISHLDVNRLMTRAVRRAKLPMWYTEGFNPHPYIAFALPLPLGQSSESEFMDIRVTGDITNDEVVSLLREVMPQGIEIISAGESVHSSNEIASACYDTKLIFKNEAEAKEFSEKSRGLLCGTELIAEKMGKKGHRKVLKQVNLIEQIYKADISQSGAEANFYLELAAGNTVNLNPDLLFETLAKYTLIEPQNRVIHRINLKTKDGEIFY